jgi:hypothetical protein
MVSVDDVGRIDTDTACAIVWLDWLVMNPDRTSRNPNLMWWKSKLWLIDHGASLGFQHNWPAISEDTPRRPSRMPEHVLKGRAIGMEQWDAILAERVSRHVLRAAIADVPDDFLKPDEGDASAETLRRRREAYVAVLWKRLTPPRLPLG